MKLLKSFLVFSVVWVLSLVESKHTHHYAEKGADLHVMAQKRVIDPLSVIGLAVSIGSTIQGGICTFTDVCSSDDLGARIGNLEVKMDAMQKDIDEIKKDVKNTLINTQVKWYLDHIKYINQKRSLVMKSIKDGDNSASAKDEKELFCAQVLGAEGQDETVSKALFFIPGIITENNIIKTYSEMVGSTDGYRQTWRFIKRIFTLQSHGYASMILANGIRYKEDTVSYKKEMAKICTMWSKTRSEEFTKLCDVLEKNPILENRRKTQTDFLLNMEHTWTSHPSGEMVLHKSYLPALPVLLDTKDCSQFRHASGLHYAAGHLFVAQRENRNILIVHPKTLAILNTKKLVGNRCGGACHPLDVSVHVEKKVLAVAAKSTANGKGTSYVLFYKIKGDFDRASEITYQYYHKLSLPTDAENDVRSLAFCGNRFGYADHSRAAMFHWRTKEENSNLQPDLTTKKNWYMQPLDAYYKSTINYMECSNMGDSWVLEKTLETTFSNGFGDGVGTVSVDNLMDTSYNIIDSFSNKVVYDDVNWEGKYNPDWHITRMEKLTGVAMDKKQNLFFGTEQINRGCINGIYKHTSDDKLHVLREWHRESTFYGSIEMKYPMRVGDMAADDNGYLYVLQKDGDKDQCLYKYDHQKDLEDIELDGLEEEKE